MKEEKCAYASGFQVICQPSELSSNPKWSLPLFQVIVQVSIHMMWWIAHNQHSINELRAHRWALSIEIGKSKGSWSNKVVTSSFFLKLFLGTYFDSLYKYTAFCTHSVCRNVCWSLVYLQTNWFNSSLSSAVFCSNANNSQTNTTGSKTSFVPIFLCVLHLNRLWKRRAN